MTDKSKSEIASFIKVPQRRVACVCGAIYTGTKEEVVCGCGKKYKTTDSGCVLKIVTGTWIFPDGKRRSGKSGDN